MIKKHVEDMCSIEGTFSNNKMWELKKKIYTRATELPSAKEDPENKILVSNPQMLKDLTLKVFIDRLKHHKILPHLVKYKELREELLNIRLESTKLNKSPEWTGKDLDNVLKKLKSGKCQDPAELVNELFKLENISEDLKESLFFMLPS